MFRNHLKFAFRLFYKDRFYSLLNISGLVLGITTGIILFLVVQYDLGYDSHNEKHERIYRYTNLLEAPGVKFNFAVVAPELANVFMEEIPEIEAITRFYVMGDLIIKIAGDKNNHQLLEAEVLKADSNVFDVFTLPVLEGDPKTALTGKYKAVLTASTAEKLFQQKSALGELIILPDNQTYQITAVIQDLPANSHMKYDMLISEIPERTGYDDYEYSEGFWNPDTFLFILFQKGFDPQKFYERFPAIYDKTFRPFGDKINGTAQPLLEPLAKIHFHSTKEGDYPQGDIKYLYAFLAIGAFIILLACINYTNLSTARAVNRTSEMAIRKVLGFSKIRLFFSILGEALIMATVAMFFAILLSYYIIHATSLDDLLGRDLDFNFLSNPYLITGIPLLTFIIGILSGIYPALFIPSIPIIPALKGSKNVTFPGSWIRKTLISFQFIISLFVIICTVIMGRQIEFLRKSDLGFNKENVVLVNLSDQLQNDRFIAPVKNKLLEETSILNVTTANGAPGIYYGNQVYMVESEEGMVQQLLNVANTQADYLQTLNLQLLLGRDFDPKNESDYFHSYIINETALKALGWEDNPIGKKIAAFRSERPGKVIGVVKDFNYVSLHNKIEPLIIRLNKYPGNILYIRIAGNNIQATIRKIEQIWKNHTSRYPFDYFFLDQNFQNLYKEDQAQYLFLNLLSYICIFISFLGLIGLSSFTASQKTKEIGIRKVLGASLYNILTMFSKGYIKIIFVAFIIAVPVANYTVTEWMNNYERQIAGSPWFFIIPGMLVLAAALITVCLQSFQAARANPVNTLKSE